MYRIIWIICRLFFRWRVYQIKNKQRRIIVGLKKCKIRRDNVSINSSIIPGRAGGVVDINIRLMYCRNRGCPSIKAMI
jgi:hypothetical protein